MPETPSAPVAPERDPGPGAAPETARRQPPRVVTVLAGAGVLVALVGLLAVVSPTVRDELRLSLTRQDAPYVETYFADVPGTMACSPGLPRFRTTVVVGSHLREAERVPVVMALVPRDGARARVARAAVQTEPGETAEVELALAKPRGAFDVRVTFPGRDQRLVVHCERGTR